MQKKSAVVKAALIILALLLIMNLAGCTKAEDTSQSNSSQIIKGLEEGKSYSSKDEVAEYIHKYKELPPNFITKKEADALGWKSSDGNLWEVTNKASIGGDIFGNREGLLPKKKGRVYYECDINYQGGYRGAERIVFSNDGLIFYTSDHYESFEEVYGEGK